MPRNSNAVATGTPRMHRGRRSTILVWVVSVLPLCAGQQPGAAAEIAVDSTMYSDPPIDIAVPTKEWPPELKPLWMEALGRPESDLQREAADAIVRAHAAGMPGLAGTADALAKALEQPDLHPVVRYAAARSLIVIDAKDKAPLLWEQAQAGGSEIAQLVEPVLLKWGYAPLAAAWVERLGQGNVSNTQILLAVRGLGALRETKAGPRLLELAKSRGSSAAVRLEAARAVAKIQTENLAADAKVLMAEKSRQGLLGRLIAASLLAQHKGDEAVALLNELAVDEEPAVAAVAQQRLLEVDPSLLGPFVAQMLGSPDANVRRIGIRALAAATSDVNLRRIAPLLDDTDPTNRQLVRDTLLASAGDATLGPVVREVAMSMLATDKWRGIEQSALLLATIDHKPAADRLAQLLGFDRSEVYVTAAWALRQLAVPSALPAMQARVEGVRGKLDSADAIDAQVCQIFQTFGKMKYAEARPLMERYISRSARGQESRAAAIWALGFIHEDKSDPQLAGKFAERLADVEGNIPEDERVRRMSAIGLGRMKAANTMATLRRFAGWRQPASVASLWAISRITNEPMPQKEVFYERQRGWFLEPVN